MSALPQALYGGSPKGAVRRAEPPKAARLLGPVANPRYNAVKRCLDVVLATLALVMFAPMLLLCLALVRLSSPGPVILRQIRLGKHGRMFRMLKFRTMYRDAEASTGPMLAQPHDERVVPACRWMRISHMDELPQLINVLRGEMSLVGPRPERPEIAEAVSSRLPEFRRRLTVLPGITGLAQVCNGYDTCIDAFQHKLRYDLDYIRRRSLAMELWILARTTTKLCDASAR
jgi:lipopolysaccharide/colanic/teichoic acid biosynthesis glycosyltransferase